MSADALRSLPWRGPGKGRPALPLPPAKLPLRFAGTTRKRWRYVAVFADELMLCAARVQVGPLGQTFWAVLDRERGELVERTVTLLPGARGEVWTEAEAGAVRWAPEGECTTRIEGREPRTRERVRAFLRFGNGGRWVESVCPNGAGGYVWTRKRAGAPIAYDVRIGERRLRGEAPGIEDESAGYHPRRTVWNWSAGVGELADGRTVAWNLVEGVNDPQRNSERAIWVEGAPFEPEPVRFEGLDAVAFADGARLEFTAEAERAKAENRMIVRYSYRQPFGAFRGTLPGGLELARGLGVMEHHDATW
ncbi:MAG TPA: DUF2804 family protein [Solirubrobacterales bacterium]|jgi:hypothetical protein